MPHQTQNHVFTQYDHPDRQFDTTNGNGQLAIESDNHLIVGNYNIQIGSVHGSEVNIHLSDDHERRVTLRSQPVMLLPRPFPQLVGRRTEISAAIASIGSARSIEFYGAPGIGKTVLLRHLAYVPQITAPFMSGAVHLSGCYHSAPDHLQSLFEALYDCDPNFKPTVEQLRHYLQAQCGLVLLDEGPDADDATHPDQYQRDLEALMNAAPDCTFILASSERRLWGEGSSMPLQGLALDEAIALLEADLGRVVDPQERPAAETLCHLLHGHPQELLYAAGHIRATGLTFEQMVQRVQSSAPRKYLVQLIWSQLSRPQRLVLATLAAVSGAGLLVNLIASLTALPEIEALLRSLLERNLLQSDGHRFAVSDSLSTVLEDGLNLDPARSQVLSHYITWAEDYALQPDKLLTEIDGIFRSLDWAIRSGRWAEALRLIRAIEAPLALSKRWGLWTRALQWALISARSLADASTEAWALHQMGSRDLCLNNPDSAYHNLSEALQIRETLGDQVGAAVTRHNLNLLLLPTDFSPDELQPAPVLELPETIQRLPSDIVVAPATQMIVTPVAEAEEPPSGLPSALKWLLFLLPLMIGGAIAGPLIWRSVLTASNEIIANDDEIVIEGVADRFNPVEVDVLANDQVKNGTLIRLLEVSQPRYGSAYIDNGRVFYGPEPGFSGTDEFTYLIEDREGNRDRGRIIAIVRPDASGNADPVATDDTATTEYETPVRIAVLENDRDTNGDELAVTLKDLPANGMAEVSSNGQVIIYRPNEGFVGEDPFTYTLSDRKGGTTTGTVTVTVQAPAVSAVDLSTEASYGTATTLDVLADNPYPIAGGRSVSIAADPEQGSAAVNADNTITYTPDEGFYGSDRFQYRITSASGQSATGTITVQVYAPALTAPTYRATTRYNSPVTVNVLQGNPYPGNLVFRIVEGPEHGTVQTQGTGEVVYTPRPDFLGGTDQVTYEVRDDRGQAATGTVTFEVASPGVTAPGYTVETQYGEPARIDLLLNNSYPNPDSLSVTISSSPQNGTVELTSNEVAIYQPRSGFVGTDRFQYTVRSPQGQSASGTVTVNVTGAPPPTVRDDQASVTSGMRVSIDVLSNDAGDRLTISGVSSPQRGSATISGNAVIYSPNSEFSGQDSFTYTVTDALGRAATATVQVTVERPPNRPPNAQDDAVTTAYFQALPIDVLSNDSDPDGDRLQIVDLTAPSNGSASLSGTTIIYTPNRGFVGTDTFQYVVSDGSQTATATVRVTVEQETPF